MTPLEIRTALRERFRSGAPLDEVRTILVRLRDGGARREDVLATLESLRQEAPDEAIEDRILEALDLVVGFSSPHMRIWPEPEAG